MKSVLKSIASGLFFVAGQGFIAPTQEKATQLEQCKVDCLKGLVEPFTVIEIPKFVSFAVVYIRKGDVNGAALNKQIPNANQGQTDPSKRRFATLDEADCHGSHFRTRRAHRGDKPGTAEHVGFFTIQTNDAVNAVVNWKTRLTNPVKA